MFSWLQKRKVKLPIKLGVPDLGYRIYIHGVPLPQDPSPLQRGDSPEGPKCLSVFSPTTPQTSLRLWLLFVSCHNILCNKRRLRGYLSSHFCLDYAPWEVLALAWWLLAGWREEKAWRCAGACVGACAGVGAGVGGTPSSSKVVGPARRHDRRSGKPKTECSAPGGEDLALERKTTIWKTPPSSFKSSCASLQSSPTLNNMHV